MQPLHLPTPLALTLLALSPLAPSSPPPPPATWIVDASGGGQFVDIPPAIVAAADGDLILVLPGFYSSFTVDKALTVIGEPGVRAQHAVIQSAPGPVALADLDLWTLQVLACDEAVVLDGLEVAGPGGFIQKFVGQFPMNVEDSADVRLIDSTVAGLDSVSPSDGDWGLRVSGSRVEVVGSTLSGGNGSNSDCVNSEAGDGGTGLYVRADSFVHTAATQASGGDGGYWEPGLCATGYVGWSGDGGWVEDGMLVTAGGSYAGGQGQKANGCSKGGDGLVGSAGATLRHSGTTFIRGPGAGGCGPGRALFFPNKVHAVPDDPVLERLDEPVVAAGSTVRLRLTAQPGSFARLFLGPQAQVLPKPGSYLELLLVKQSVVSLGVVPASGVVSYHLDLSPAAGYAPGTTLFAQAVSVYPGGEHRPTNSVPMVLR